MCRNNGLSLLIKINKKTTKEYIDDILPLRRHLCHDDIDPLHHDYMSHSSGLMRRNTTTCHISKVLSVKILNVSYSLNFYLLS